MVSIVTKKIKGKEYLYLVDSVREKNKVIQKNIKYIGKKRPILKEEFESMLFSYKKQDLILNKSEDTLSYQDHNLMKKASKNYDAYLKSLDKVSRKKEKERFLSLFVSNSNAIEGSTMTPKETYDYLFNDTVPIGRNKKELFMANNLMNAWDYVEKNYKRFPNKNDILKLHSFVNKDIESEETLGKYKSIQNYIGDIYTSSYLFTEERMEFLFEWIKKAFKRINDFEVAFQSHAQFEVIHPFVDGNGRVGRLILNWLLIYNKLNPLAIPVKRRAEYLEALENSRRGKIEAISKFCFNVYIKQYDFITD